jgi:MFS family permease
MITRASAPRPSPPVRVSIGYLYRLAPLACVGAAGAGVMNANFFSLAPVFTQRIGLSLNETSLFMAVTVMSGMLLQWPLGRLSDRIGRPNVLGGATAATGIACLGIALFAETAGAWLFAMAAVYGGTVFTVYSISSAQANDLSGPEDLVMTAGSLLIAFGVGAIAGPTIGGLLMRTLSPEALFAFNGTIALFISLFAFRRSRAMQRARALGRFLPTPSTQYTSGLLYRRVRDQIDRDVRRYGQYSGRQF